jgi:hypothetical protein
VLLMRRIGNPTTTSLALLERKRRRATRKITLHGSFAQAALGSGAGRSSRR